MALAETANLAVRLSLKDGLSSGLRGAAKSVGTFDRGIGRVGKGVGQLGVGLARAGTILGVAVATGVAAATRAAIDYEDAFAGVRKTVDATEPELQALSLAFREMATTIPIAATEFARIGELGGALGIAPENLAEFTRTVALLGVTTNVATDDAATALGQLSNVLNLTADDYDNFASTLVDLGNKGASTESAILEITRRAGSSARLIDLAADATLGWSAAVANLGDNPELAGTALQMFFQKSLETVSNGGAKLKLFAEVAGTTGKAFKKAFAKDSSAALQTFIAGLSKLPKDQRLAVVQDLFGKRTGLTRTILGLADSYDKNLVPALNNAGTAWEQNTALAEESRKRFETVRSSVSLLKNNLIEAAMVLGEGVAPAIGRAATKLAEFLRNAENRAALKALGEDIGKAIDGIDWARLFQSVKGLGAAIKPALAVALKLAELIAKLPPELLGAGAGLIITNKLSGGLVGQGIGNIVGGVAELFAKSVITRIPVIGPGFVQHVWVDNMMGALPTGGKTGKLGNLGSTIMKVAVVGIAVDAAAVLASQLGEQSTGIQEQGRRLTESAKTNAPKMTEGELVNAIQNIDDQLKNPLNAAALIITEPLNNGLSNLDRTQQALKAELTLLRANKMPAGATGKSAAIEEARRTTNAVQAARVQSKQDSVVEMMAEKQTAAAVRTGLGTNSAKLSTANARLAAIQRKKTHFTSVTNVNIPITIRDIQNVQTKRRRIVKRNQLATI